jgi:hypothetical protein
LLNCVVHIKDEAVTFAEQVVMSVVVDPARS